MAGEQELSKLLATMEPTLQDGTFVFATIEATEIPEGLRPVGMFREAEGMTLIMPLQDAVRAGLTASKPMRQITLTVHSSLEAVGLTAALATEMTWHGISANVVAGYYHDHVFVGAEDADRALATLRALSARQQ